MAEFQQELRKIALKRIDAVSVYEQQHGQYGVKAGVWALACLRKEVSSVEDADSRQTMAQAILDRMEQFRSSWKDDAFHDEYSAAKGIMGSAISAVAEDFSAYLEAERSADEPYQPRWFFVALLAGCLLAAFAVASWI